MGRDWGAGVVELVLESTSLSSSSSSNVSERVMVGDRLVQGRRWDSSWVVAGSCGVVVDEWGLFGVVVGGNGVRSWVVVILRIP